MTRHHFRFKILKKMNLSYQKLDYKGSSIILIPILYNIVTLIYIYNAENDKNN